jgi:hypothetical protein
LLYHFYLSVNVLAAKKAAKAIVHILYTLCQAPMYIDFKTQIMSLFSQADRLKHLERAQIFTRISLPFDTYLLGDGMDGKTKTTKQLF